MNSTNETKKKSIREIDIRDLGRFLLLRSWIIAIAAIVCIAVSLIFTFNITPKYSSSSSMIVIAGKGNAKDSWTIGHEIVQTAPQIISGNEFCESVATMLSQSQADNSVVGGKTNNFEAFCELTKNKSDQSYIYENLFFVGYDENDTPMFQPQSIGYYTGFASQRDNKNYIYSILKSSVKVLVDENSPNTLTVIAETTNPQLSYIIANAITVKYKERISKDYNLSTNSVINSTNITLHTDIYDTGYISSLDNPTNQSYLKNAVVAAFIAIAVSCAVLVVIFIFDDKIKTPDDIEKHLELNILGTIPDFETKWGVIDEFNIY